MKQTPELSPFEAGRLRFALPYQCHWLCATLHKGRNASQDVALVVGGNSLSRWEAVGHEYTVVTAPGGVCPQHLLHDASPSPPLLGPPTVCETLQCVYC